MWQTRIGDMLDGYGHARMYWNITDVRDIAETQRLIGESKANKNGDRYNLVAPDESGLMTQLELADMLRGFYPVRCGYSYAAAAAAAAAAAPVSPYAATGLWHRRPLSRRQL
jgi:hypothetical protein|eukprot:COSAG06_NODE_5180_length_3656_cov_2.089401_3_plen_112_part_00